MLQQNALTLRDLRMLAEQILMESSGGKPLDSLEIALIELGVATSVTSLDRTAIERAIANAFAASASAQQIQELQRSLFFKNIHQYAVIKNINQLKQL